MEQADESVQSCKEENGGRSCENIEITVAQSETIKKKRNRRKENSRQKKSKVQAEQIESLENGFHSLALEPGVVSHGASEASETVPENACNSHPKSPLTDGSPSKSKRKRKKNVALSSIQKLSSSLEPKHLTGNPKISSNSLERASLVQEINSVEEGSIQHSSPLIVKKEVTGHSSNTKNPSPKKTYFSNNSIQSQELSPKKTSAHHASSSGQFKQKKLGGTKTKSRNSKSNMSGTGETVLNDNLFEPHLQRELIDVMLKGSNVVKGFIRINQRNFREAYISNPDGSKDIVIEGVQARNRALEGDEVVISILPERLWRPLDLGFQKVGKVIHILTPVHHRQAVGTLKKMQDGNSRVALFSPRDSRIPRLRIPMNECPKNPKEWEGRLFFARITEWDDVRFAKGRLIGDSFGGQGDVEAETRAILLDNELDCSPFDRKLYDYFPTPPYKISTEDLFKREDLRKHCVFTIDPETARDLDDALSCEKLDNGNYKIGVHISDVTHFLKEGTPLDKEVAKRATTTYLVQRAYHMLPREMTMMCSLLPGEDKLAFSVFWEMTSKAEVVSHYFTRTIINSCCQLAYEHAQIMIDDPEHEWKNGELPSICNGWTVKDIEEKVLMLQSLAVIMRKRRFDTGALRVDQTKLSFCLDSGGKPLSFSAYINKESHRLIEEFMLLANITVATALQAKFPSLAFLRCHDEPQPDMMKKLAEVLEKFGILLDASSAGSVHNSLQRYCCSGDQARAVALNSLCSRPMTRARYFCAASISDLQYMRHYALNVPLYTHFTSPIRRYADVMVHRLLSALLGYTEEPQWTIDFVNSIASNCNKMKFCAKKAGEQSTELFYALWVKEHGPIQEEAVVVDVKDHSFDAVVCSTGFNIRVYTDKLPGSVEFENILVPQLQIRWAVAGGCSVLADQVVSMFSVVKVSLQISNTNLLKIEAHLCPPLK